MGTVLILVLCFAFARSDSNGFEIFINTNASPSTNAPSGDQPQNSRSASCTSCPVLDSSALRIEHSSASELPLSVHDRPTNGFWPNPEAVRMFLGRNADSQLSGGQLAEPSSPSPSVLIHRAIYPHFRPSDETVTHTVSDEGSWNVHPNPDGFNDLNYITTNPLPKPDISLSALVHLISGGMGGGGGDGDVEATTSVTTGEERPLFLSGIADDVIQKYYEITGDSTLSEDEMRDALMQWRRLLPPDSLRSYEEVQEEKDQMLAMERSHHTEGIPPMGEVAKQTAELAQAVQTDDGFTETEKGAQLQDVRQSVPEEMKEKLIMV